MQNLKQIFAALAVLGLTSCNDGAKDTEKAIENAENVAVDSLESKNDSLAHIIDSVSAGKKSGGENPAHSLKK